ncbi:MAG: hypothetical protein AB8I40_11140 [Anaerolineales bacterium]
MNNEPKKTTQRADWIALGLILLLAIFYILTLPQVPFHPDESTHLYMSRDLSTFFQDPQALVWDGSLPLSDEQRIRAIDAPLAKVWIGIGRGIFSVPALQADWNWSASWAENGDRGALPSPRQLLISRGAVTLALAAGLWLFYLAVKKTLPSYAGLAAVVLLGLNPLVLLHGRRAMSEGILLFSLGFFLWTATREKRQPWLIGLAFALALNAKHTALGLLPAALYAVSLVPGQKPQPGRIASRSLRFLLAAAVLTALLNPFYWRQPVQALQVGLESRFSLSRQQEIDHLSAIGTDQLTVGQRGLALVANTFITSPQTEEVGNYLAETRQSRQEYLSNPVNSWGRGPIAGGALLILSLLGFALTVKQLVSQPDEGHPTRLIWILSTLGLVLVLFLPLPWQRYVIPLLPFSVFWIISGLVPLVDGLRRERPSS